ncbi:tetratricopeptide repeat protein [Xanthobacter sp. VTT E-85241]|uniref:tetratricopeptide repeat protein n=1 Tax=Roseixanthobacter finlandensis TaxID=3119922 RepID=UPI003729C3BB
MTKEFESVVAMPSNWDERILHHLANNEVAAALELARAAVDARPECEQAHGLLGDALWKSREPLAAARAFAKSLEINPTQHVWQYRKAVVLAYEQKAFHLASSLGRQALSYFPEDATLTGFLGLSLYAEGPDDGAMKLIRRGLKLDPDLFGSFYVSYAFILEGSGKIEQAREDFGEAIAELKRRPGGQQALGSAYFALAQLLHKARHFDALRPVLTDMLEARPDLETAVEHMMLDAYGQFGDEHEEETDVARGWSEQVRQRILAILAGTAAAPLGAGEATAPRSAGLATLLQGFRFFCPTSLSEADRATLLELGIAPAFLDAAAAGPRNLAASSLRDGGEGAWWSDPAAEPRVRDVLESVYGRAKPVLSPFSGNVGFSTHSLAPECFLLSEGGNVCLVIQWTDTDQASADHCWVFPAKGIVIAFPFQRVQPKSLFPQLFGVFSALLAREDEFRAYLSAPPRTIAVSEFMCPHIGHYIWNCVSGWDPFFRHGGAALTDFYVVHDHVRMLGSVGELYEDEVAKSPLGVKALRPNEDPVDLILRHGALLLTIKNRFVSADLATRVVKWAYRNCSEEFLTKARAFRASCEPMVLITIRLDNRCWVEQGTGWIELIKALKGEFPRIGFLLDGLNRGTVQGWTHALMSLEAEEKISDPIVDACGDDGRIFNSIGCTIAESLVLADLADCFIAPVGAGMAKYRWIANLPGVAFSNVAFSQAQSFDGRLYDHFREGAVAAVHVAPEDVRDVQERLGVASRANFSMDWQALHRLAVPFLADLLAAKTVPDA